MTAIMILKPVRYPPKNVKTPIPNENNVTIMTNLSISCWINFGFYSYERRSSDIYENKLLFPVFITRPFPVPYKFSTPEKSIFFAIKGLL